MKPPRPRNFLRRLPLPLAAALIAALAFAGSALATQYFSGTLTYPHAVIPSNTSSSSSQVTKNSGGACVAALYTPPSTGILACSNGETETVSAFSQTGHDPAYQATCDVTSAGSTHTANLTCRYFNGF